MKTYLVTGVYGKNLTQALSKLGKTEDVSLMYNMYSLETTVSLEEILNVENVVSAREEEKACLLSD